MDPREVVGVVLAGGGGRRLGGRAKAVVELAGQPLLSYPLAALAEVCPRVAVVAKRDNPVLPLPHGVELWIEPDQPRHPRTGLVTALQRAGGAILVCAADMPLLDAAELRAILLADDLERGREPAVVVPRAAGHLQPLCALYRPAALAALADAGPRAALHTVVAGLDPLILERRAEPYLNVNTPTDLVKAERLIRT